MHFLLKVTQSPEPSIHILDNLKNPTFHREISVSLNIPETKIQNPQ